MTGIDLGTHLVGLGGRAEGIILDIVATGLDNMTARNLSFDRF